MALYQLRMPTHHFAETIINNFFRASFRALEVPTQEQCPMEALCQEPLQDPRPCLHLDTPANSPGMRSLQTQR